MTTPADIAAVIRAALASLPTETLRAANSTATDSRERLQHATSGTSTT